MLLLMIDWAKGIRDFRILDLLFLVFRLDAPSSECIASLPSRGFVCNTMKWNDYDRPHQQRQCTTAAKPSTAPTARAQQADIKLTITINQTQVPKQHVAATSTPTSWWGKSTGSGRRQRHRSIRSGFDPCFGRPS